MADDVELFREYRFEAAHWLPFVADDHKCKRLHGHSYQVTVTVAGPVNPDTGMLVDYNDIDAIAEGVIGAYDHRCLNDFITNPTVEHLTARLCKELAALPLAAVTVRESDRAACRMKVLP